MEASSYYAHLCESSTVPMASWIATACYTLNRSLVHTLHGKTYYELLKGKKPNLQYFRVFGSLCYPTNDYDDVTRSKGRTVADSNAAADHDQPNKFKTYCSIHTCLGEVFYCNHDPHGTEVNVTDQIEYRLYSVQMATRGLFGWLKRLGGWLGTPEPTKNNLDADMASSDWWIWNMTAANDKMSTLAEFMIVAGADNHPPMLDKPQYESWKSHMELYIQGKDHGWIILNSIENGPLVWPTVALENGTVRPKTYEKLSDKEKLQADCDLKATNIVLQGLPPDVYALVNHDKVSKDIWDRVKLLIQGTSLSKQERECKLYDEFDKFSYVKGETLHQYHLRLPPEWGKFVTDVKLARDLHTSNYDQLYLYLEQHEVHANETRLMREIFPDPLALVANYHQQPSHFNNYHSQYTTPQYPQQFSPPTQHVYSSPPQSNPYGAPHHPQQYPTTYPTNHSHTQPSVTQNAYPPLTIPQQPQAEFPQIDSGLAVPTFLPGDDPITCMNKAMAFLSAVFTLRYPSTNNQLRSSSNPRNQATVQDGRVTVQQVQGRQGQNVVGSGSQGNASGSRGNTSGQAKAEGKELDEEQLAFLIDPGVADGQVAQTITHNAAFQTDDLDAYDSDCDDISLAKAVLMANLSSCDSDVLSEVPYSNTSQNDMMNQSVHEFQYFELSPIVDYLDDEITSDSNIIPYSQYLEETQQAIVQNTNTSTQQNSMILSMFEQMSNHATNWDRLIMKRIKQILYDGNVLSKTHDVLCVVDDEETLILAEESRLKMVEKQNDPIIKKEKINITPINYSGLNKLAEDFGKRFVPQQELSTEQMFWLQSSNKNSEEPGTSNTPVKIEVLSELPKVSLVNKSLKKLRFHLASFDKLVKVRTIPDAITEGLLDEITEVQTVFTQMEADVEQCSVVDRKCCEIQ
ncbi:hypothetical protein Tco_1055397 [Tanacetum coccineum]|uniref:Integrase, catalytic region, zinc finger, CCHC-type, peptidase aspartic, catalytic n=1 Tax=Tanacetum coccineum TaxID=301880 RepID=A0ABQ5H081_9ASTR